MLEAELTRMNLPKRYWTAKWEVMSTENQVIVQRYVAEAFPSGMGKGLLLYGDEGRGKTYISAVIAKILRQKEYQIYFVPSEDLTQQVLRKDFDAESTVLERCQEVDLLIIDDVNMMTDKSVLYSILKYRMDNLLSTIVTLRLRIDELPVEEESGVKKRSFKHWFEKFYGDIFPVVKGCILPIPIIGDNYREKEVKEYVRIMFPPKESV